MSDLKTNLEEILQEKETKIIPANIKKDVQIFDVVGTYEGEEGIDTSDATAIADDILTSKTAYGSNGKLTGTMPNNGELNYTPSSQVQTIPAGYTSGGNVSGDSNLLPENIKSGITIFGITGTYTGNSNVEEE